MKKIMTSLFALAAVFCASAAVPTYTVNPTSDSVLENKTQEIVFTFSEAVRVDSVDFVGGERFNNPITTRVATGMTAPATTVTINAVEAYWGNASSGEFHLEVYLPAIYNEAGEQIMETGVDPDTQKEYSYPFTAVSYYSTPDNAPVVFEGIDPQNADVTVWNLYMDGWGSVNFIFSGEVDFSNATAVVRYTTTGDTYNKVVANADIWGDWDFWTGKYMVNVPLPAEANLTEANLRSIAVSLSGIQVNGTAITVTPALFNNVTVANPTKKANGSAGINSTLATSSSFDIYNVQGVRVAENASMENLKNLPKGIYVANGKKFVVR